MSKSQPTEGYIPVYLPGSVHLESVVIGRARIEGPMVYIELDPKSKPFEEYLHTGHYLSLSVMPTPNKEEVETKVYLHDGFTYYKEIMPETKENDHGTEESE